MVDFDEMCNVCARKAIIVAAKRIINSDKMCRSYSELNFGVIFLKHSVYRKSHDGQELLTRSLPRSAADFQRSPINPFALLVLQSPALN